MCVLLFGQVFWNKENTWILQGSIEPFLGRAYKGVKKENISNVRWNLFVFFVQVIFIYKCVFLMENVFLGFSMQNHPESYGNYVENYF